MARHGLFDVKPSDPATLLAVTALMLAAAAVAAYMPARRSTRVEPMMLLESE